MAVTSTTVLAGYTTFIASVIATADADVTTGNLTHGLGSAPLMVGVTPILTQALTALSAWAITYNATVIAGTKLASTGSGNASPQVLLWAMLPHSLIR